MKSAILLATLVLLAGLWDASQKKALEAFPEFELAGHAGATHNNSMYAGTPYVAYFSAAWCSTEPPRSTPSSTLYPPTDLLDPQP